MCRSIHTSTHRGVGKQIQFLCFNLLRKEEDESKENCLRPEIWARFMCVLFLLRIGVTDRYTLAIRDIRIRSNRWLPDR